jgi:branched-chain amino acid transport system permease protein
VSNAVQFYVSTLLIYGVVSIIACWGLDLQFGDTGILNFAFIMFQAVGAYTAAVLTLGPSTQSNPLSNYQEYILGASVPYPLSVFAAALAGALLSYPVGVVALRRLRSDYQAVAMLVVSLIATTIVISDTGLLDGERGLFLIPKPLRDYADSLLGYQWLYVGMSCVFLAVALWVVARITRSPLGRSLRAIRESESAAAALGKNVLALRMGAFVVGNMIAAISGALLVQFIGSWSPNGWLYPETFVYLGAIIIGGAANKLGVLIGALLLPVGISEGVRYLPSFGGPGLVGAVQFMLIGALIIGFMWFRPRGLVPERRRTFGNRRWPFRRTTPGAGVAAAMSSADEQQLAG